MTDEPNSSVLHYIGGLSEINAKGASVKIGDHCDIASFGVSSFPIFVCWIGG